jgi:hypothetical protein
MTDFGRASHPVPFRLTALPQLIHQTSGGLLRNLVASSTMRAMISRRDESRGAVSLVRLAVQPRRDVDQTRRWLAVKQFRRMSRYSRGE